MPKTFTFAPTARPALTDAIQLAVVTSMADTVTTLPLRLTSYTSVAEPEAELTRYSCHRPRGFYPCLARAGCSARRNPRGRRLVPAHGHRYLGATADVSGCLGIPLAPPTTMVTHPLSYTLPIDAVKSVATSADEQERLVCLSRPSQHDTVPMHRPIFESFAQALRVAPRCKIG